ncbi:site-2 protease family protein [Patescibacteria group bacterium]|nr:site-2 protease family protein [Patescibacteria group bacterium]
MENIQSILFLYIIVVLSAIIHEYAHAWAALRQGDTTAKYAGRLTLNPLAHIDWWGTVLMPLLLLSFFGVFFGYAKPVPINPYNFKDQRKGMIYVSIAGVAANFLIAIALGLFIRLLPNFYLNPFLQFIVLVNIWLGLFNLLPFPPLDGSKLLMAAVDYQGGGRWAQFVTLASTPFGILIAIFVAMTFLPYLSNFIFRIIIGG